MESKINKILANTYINRVKLKVKGKTIINAKPVGDMYAGDIEHRGVDYYLDRAFHLGRKLV